MTSNFKIEEYKFAKEKIRKNEERRYQMLILCVTAFGVVFGFSDKIPDFIIPIALLIILVISLSSYRNQSNRQSFTTAYIICFFEENIQELNYESTLVNFGKLKSEKKNWKIISKLKRFISSMLSPFSILFIATFFSLIFYGNNYYIENSDSIANWEIVLFIVINAIGYTYALLNIYLLRKKNVNHYINELN